MKTNPLLHLAVLGITLLFMMESACAQGTINFNNNVVGVLKAPVYDVEPGDSTRAKCGNTSSGVPVGGVTYGGAALAGTGFTAALFAGPVGTDSSALTLVTTTTFRTGSAAGSVVAPTSAVMIASVPAGSPATVQLRAWNNQGGTVTTWAAAQANTNVVSGVCAAFTAGPLGATNADAPNLTNLVSFNLHLSASPPPVLTQQPQSLTVRQGQTAVFSVVATGSEPLSYQWIFCPTRPWNQATNVLAATGPTLTITNAQPTNAGDYFVIVTNSYGSVTSLVANLAVLLQPCCSPLLSNLVVNGSFEEPVVTGSSNYQYFPSIPGWTGSYSGGTAEIELWRDLSYITAQAGVQHLEINAHYLDPTVSQVVTGLIPGRRATFCFWYIGRPGALTNSFRAELSGGASTSVTLNAAPDVDPVSWQFYATTFTPTSSTVTITFSGEFTGAHIDNVAIIIEPLPPTITCAPDKTVECGSTWSYDPPTATGTYVSMSMLTSSVHGTACAQTNSVVFLATDLCGQTATCTQTVTVVDTKPPVIYCTDFGIPCGTPWSFTPPPAFDEGCSNTVTVTAVSTITNGSCPIFIERAWRATDACGNSTICTQHVAIVDTEPPVIHCPDNIRHYTCSGNDAVGFAVSATDACDPNLIVVCTPPSGSSFPVGTTTVLCAATDSCGNTSSCEFSIAVILDTLPRVFRAGQHDNFASPTDPASRRLCLNAAYPAVTWEDFDEPNFDRFFGQSFVGLPAGLVRAELTIRMKPLQNGPGNDTLSLGLIPPCGTPTWAWSQLIQSLPGAGGAWGINPATTFVLDLGNLPGGGNIIAKLAADQFLDVLVQDDTTVDWMELKVWMCEPPNPFFGLDHVPIGEAQLAHGSDGSLVLLNLGTNVPGGVSVNLGHADGWWSRLDFPAELSDVGVEFHSAVRGRVNGVDDQVIGSARIAGTGGAASLTVDYSSVGSTSIVVKTYNGDGLALGMWTMANNSPIEIRGTRLSFIGWGCGPGQIAIGEGQTGVSPRSLEDFFQGFTNDVQIIGPGGQPIEGVRALSVSADSVTATREFVSRVTLQATGADTLELTDEFVRKFGFFHRALGDATLDVNNGVTAYNLGTNGEDGVSINLGRADSFSITLDDQATNDVHAVSGAFLEISITGSYNGAANHALGSLRVTQLGASPTNGYEVTADLAPVDSPTHFVQVLNHGVPVASFPGHTGVVGRVSTWPRKLGKFGGDTDCVFGEHPDNTSFIINGASFVGNELRVLAETSGHVDYKSVATLHGAGIGEFTITGVQVVPLCPAPLAIACPASITTNILGTNAVVNFPTPTATNSMFVSCTPPSGSIFPLGTNLVTCTASNFCQSTSCTFNVAVRPIGLPTRLFINEWLASNIDGYPDPMDGDWDELFEIYNPGTNAVNLAGYFLTDTQTNQSKFTVPAGYVVPAGGYLLVWADNETFQNTTNFPHLHVNFTLATSGGYIGLSAPDGTALDAISFGPQTTDVSEGRWPDGGTNRYFMTRPTPGAANALDIPTIITVQPQSQTNCVGSTVTLTVTATGTGPFSYQWKKNTVAINGATASTFTIPVAQLSDAGTYTVMVSNSGGSVTSAQAILTVIECPPDIVPPTVCCGARPAFTGQPYASFAGQVAAATCWSPTPSAPVLAVIDLASPCPTLNVNCPAPSFHGPAGLEWTKSRLGNIFGLCFDDQGNIYVTATTAYSELPDVAGPGGFGAVYKIDGTTGLISTFATLPNLGNAGLGNIKYSCQHSNFYVSDIDDGKIYRLDSSGNTLSTWDHGANLPSATPSSPAMADDPNSAFTQRGRRIWGLKPHNGRLYYAVWWENTGQPDPAGHDNEIWSVALNPAGSFVGGAVREIVQPPLFPGAGHCNPVSDISFGPAGTMLLAERTMDSDTTTSAHQSRTLEYVLSGGSWILPDLTKFQVSGAPNPGSSAGGCDCDFSALGRAWVTADAIHLNCGGSPNPCDCIYGLQGLPATGGSILNSVLIDLNGDTCQQNKTQIGDVELPCPPPKCLLVADEVLDCISTNGTFTYTFCATNLFNGPISYLTLLDPPPGVTFTPDILTLPQPLQPGQGNCYTVTIHYTGTGPTNLCFRIGAHTTNFIQCCAIEHCLTLPNCCAYVFNDTMTPIPGMGGCYNYTFSVKNLTPTPIQYLILVPDPPHGCYDITPDILYLSTPLQPGQSVTRTVKVCIAATPPCPQPFWFLLSIHDTNFAKCCSVRHGVPRSAIPQPVSFGPGFDGSVFAEGSTIRVPVVIDSSVVGARSAVGYDGTNAVVSIPPPYPADGQHDDWFIISNAVAGPHVLRVALTDNLGGVWSSETVTVLVYGTPPPPTPAPVLFLPAAALNTGQVRFLLQTQPGVTCHVEYTESLSPANWQVFRTIVGDGTTVIVTDSVSSARQRFFRVRMP